MVREEGSQADAYYRSRSLPSRLGAWASAQSRPLDSRAALMAEVAKVTVTKGLDPARPPFWGGYRIIPVEIEFWGGRRPPPPRPLPLDARGRGGAVVGGAAQPLRRRALIAARPGSG